MYNPVYQSEGKYYLQCILWQGLIYCGFSSLKNRHGCSKNVYVFDVLCDLLLF